MLVGVTPTRSATLATDKPRRNRASCTIRLKSTYRAVLKLLDVQNARTRNAADCTVQGAPLGVSNMSPQRYQGDIISFPIELADSKHIQRRIASCASTRRAACGHL